MKQPYFSGRMQNAYHQNTGDVKVNDKVSLRGSPKRQGTIISITRSNHGKGRPYAQVAWNDGRTTNEPIGRLKLLNPEHH